MGFLPLAFGAPALLGAFVVLPAIWYLLKLTPPRPQREVFPPLKILAKVLKREETPAQSPWWLTLLRMAMASAVILALADPVLNPRNNVISGDGPLVVVIDNGWASTGDWTDRVRATGELIDEAERRNLPIALVFTADQTQEATPATAAVARERLTAARPKPLVPDRARAITALASALNGTRPGTLAFVTDGIESAAAPMATPSDAAVPSDTSRPSPPTGTPAAGNGPSTIPVETALQRLAKLAPGELRVIDGDGRSELAITGAENGADRLVATVGRLATAGPGQVVVHAQDQQGRVIGSGIAEFGTGAATAKAEIIAPFELRNDFARLSLPGVANAGAVHLLDDGFRRRKVALLSGDASDEFQPLLSSLHYIDRALSPYVDLIRPQGNDLSLVIPELVRQNTSVIVLADIGRLPPESTAALQQWLQKGGVLIRFAGPRLAAASAGDPLVPVVLRQGERELGGALSWAEPQPLAPFPPASPFAGLTADPTVTIKRQVLAEPSPDLTERTWASLADGTPLVTSRIAGAGRIVLFHTSAEASWSNLPISGEFVAMLRRVVQLSNATNATGSTTPAVLQPYRLITERGVLTAETGSAKPIDGGPNRPLSSSFDHPPGLYGSEDGYTALNLLPAGAILAPLATDGGTVVIRQPLVTETATPLKPHLLGLALALLVIDSLVVLAMGGALARLPKRATTAGLLLTAGLAAASLVASPGALRADDSRPGDAALLERLDTTHLAYVKTGEADVDTISERGLAGLTEFLTYRTTLEPGAPVGLDIATDELSIYPIIFWPISANAPMPSAAAISRIDAYMRAGGTVLFDTRDQLTNLGDDSPPGPNTLRLREILANIDLPALEPVPRDHVLTRSFYLLSAFPGRYSGSPLWVEARQETRTAKTGLSSSGDGVSPILITGNDFLSAWAIDANGVPQLPTVPPDENQREMSYRSGVNIMMYMLTGNYKADQVHVPALLERLGQ